MYGSYQGNDTGFFNTPNNLDTTNQTKEKGVRRLQNVVPVCVRQILDCPEEDFSMFGMRAQILSFVGILREYEVSSTKATYKIEDHTGTITAVLWLESDNGANTAVNLPPVKEGRYIRINGSQRTTDGQKTILVLKMFPVENINEITTHLLEVIHARLSAEKMSKESGTTKIVQNNPSAELANSMSLMYDGSNTGNSNNFTPLQQKIYTILQADQSEDGLSRERVLGNFPAPQRREVNTALEYLASEGHVYSTIDSEHFKATD